MLVFDVKSFLSFQPLFKFKKSFSIKLDLSLLFPEWIPFYCIKQFGYSDSTTTENMSTGWSWLDALTRTKLRFEPISVTYVIPLEASNLSGPKIEFNSFMICRTLFTISSRQIASCLVNLSLCNNCLATHYATKNLALFLCNYSAFLDPLYR